jgi:hypothetical protein
MPKEGWRELLSKEWAGCVKLHNLPFGCNSQKISVIGYSEKSIKKQKIIRSFYDLSKTAVDWNYSDF